MMEARVNNSNHVCGTVHCFAGWFTVALINEKKLTKIVDFKKGAETMARMLGFSDSWSLRVWAFQNENMWDNPDGLYMFSHKDAFYNPVTRPAGALSLSHIINHLEEVCERLPDLKS